jgi:dTDP-4-amino-4,6-dideoxygalactose transaminase
MKVPFLDLKAQYESIKDEIDAAIRQVIESCSFAGGPFVEKFEKNFAAFCQSASAIGVGSGTEALWLALWALGVGPGDEVITVPNTFIATAEAITFCGARPAFVDIDETTYTMDPQKLEDYLKRGNKKSATRYRARAVIPVHLYGHPADMDPILAIAAKYDLFVIEDASQAHGAQYRGRPAGSLGDAGCFSFYPGKNLGAYGEAGAIVTRDHEIAGRIRMLRDHGQSRKYHHDCIGWNARMDGFQGAILNVKLKHLDAANTARRKNARIYDELLSNVDNVVSPQEADRVKHVYHIYAIGHPGRDRLIAYLQNENIFCGIHYPVSLHLSKAYQHLGYAAGSFPVAERLSGRLLSLPMYPELTRDQIEYVVGGIQAFIAEEKSQSELQNRQGRRK